MKGGSEWNGLDENKRINDESEEEVSEEGGEGRNESGVRDTWGGGVFV